MNEKMSGACGNWTLGLWHEEIWRAWGLPLTHTCCTKSWSNEHDLLFSNECHNDHAPYAWLHSMIFKQQAALCNIIQLECGLWQRHSHFGAAVYITGCYGWLCWYPTYCEEFCLLCSDLIFFLVIKIVFEIILGVRHHVFHHFSYIIADSIRSFAPCVGDPKHTMKHVKPHSMVFGVNPSIIFWVFVRGTFVHNNRISKDCEKEAHKKVSSS